MLTRKDYKAIAAIIHMNRTNEPEDDTNRFLIFDQAIPDLADYMAQDNPNFDRGKFIKACHGEEK